MSYFVYAYKYGKAKKHMKRYISQLKELEKMYDIDYDYGDYDYDDYDGYDDYDDYNGNGNGWEY